MIVFLVYLNCKFEPQRYAFVLYFWHVIDQTIIKQQQLQHIDRKSIVGRVIFFY
jgi:hypothetical protein